MLVLTPLKILGIALSITGIIAGGYTLVEWLVSSTLFSIFRTVIPIFLQSVFPNDSTILWFVNRTTRNLYASWDVALIYFFLMPIELILFAGCWLFLILKLLGRFNIGTPWLIVWFIGIALVYVVSASNQYALEIKSHDRRLRYQGIIKRMFSDSKQTIKKWNYYFWKNWIIAPFTALKIMAIVFLFVLLHWPAWLIQIFPPFRFDLSEAKTRRYYYLTYSVIFLISGLLLTTLF